MESLTRGSFSSSMSTIAPSLYCWKASAFFAICSASARPLASTANASASPLIWQRQREGITFPEAPSEVLNRVFVHKINIIYTRFSTWTVQKTKYRWVKILPLVTHSDGFSFSFCLHNQFKAGQREKSRVRGRAQRQIGWTICGPSATKRLTDPVSNSQYTVLPLTSGWIADVKHLSKVS